MIWAKIRLQHQDQALGVLKEGLSDVRWMVPEARVELVQQVEGGNVWATNDGEKTVREKRLAMGLKWDVGGMMINHDHDPRLALELVSQG